MEVSFSPVWPDLTHQAYKASLLKPDSRRGHTGKNTPDSQSFVEECVESDPVLVSGKSYLSAPSKQSDTCTVHTLMKTSGNKRETGHKCVHDHTVQWEVQAVVVLGCNDAPLGGDRVLQCGSLRTSEAPLSSCFTCDDSMPACCLCIPLRAKILQQ